MAGGSNITQDKIRPGAYIGINSNGSKEENGNKLGIVLMPLSLNFGEENTFITIESEQDILSKLGGINESTLAVREALKKAKTVLVYRLNGGSTATYSLNEQISVESNTTGDLNNLISLKILRNIDDNSFLATTYFNNEETVIQRVPEGSNGFTNRLLTYKGNITSSNLCFFGGASSKSATSENYLDFLKKAESVHFNTLAITSTDTPVKDTVIAFVRRMRDDEGKKINAVLSNCTTADYEGIISVQNGVTLSDGTEIPANLATGFVAGATASALSNQSNTYLTYDGALDVKPSYSNSEIIGFLENGQLLFTNTENKVVIEKDINTFTSFSPVKNSGFSKNRMLRVLDYLANDINSIFHTSYIGKISNNAEGRSLFKGDIIKYMENLQSMGSINSFDPTSDIVIAEGSSDDSIVCELYIQPVDSMEKLYMNVTVG